jgi:pimeloyl-ACP methyl ester carboxylesterase
MIATVLLVLAIAFSSDSDGLDSPHHPYRSAEARQEFLASYDARANRWPVPSTATSVDTEYGPTFVRISGPETAPAVVLLHGAGGNSLQWRPNIAALSEHYRTYAVDVIGDHGRSTYIRPLESAADYSEWLGELLNGLGLEQNVSLVGLSYGGWIAGQYALHSPDRLNKVVLLAPAGTVLPLSFGWISRAVLCALPHRSFTRRFLYWMLEDLAQKNETSRLLLEEEIDAAFLGMQSFKSRPMVAPDVLTDSELQSFGVPVLFAVGENEKIYSATEAVERLDEVAPQIQTRTIPGAGHDLTIVQAALVNRMILGFLAE